MQDVIGDGVTHDLDQFQGQILKSVHVENLYTIISQTMTDMVQFTVDNKWEFILGLSNVKFAFDLELLQMSWSMKCTFDNDYIGNGDNDYCVSTAKVMYELSFSMFTFGLHPFLRSKSSTFRL